MVKIINETENMALVSVKGRLEIRLVGSTHSVVVGYPKDIESAQRTMERLERYPHNLRAMYSHYR